MTILGFVLYSGKWCDGRGDGPQ